MNSIDWYLNWPYSNFNSWDMVHWQVLGGVHIEGGIVEKKNSKNYFFD